MTGLGAVLVVAAAAAMLVTWAGTWTGRRPLEWAGKPAAMLLLAAAVAAAPVPNATVKALVAAGLVLGAAGDVLLMLPHERLVPGIAAFLAGHLAYLAAFVGIGLRGVPLLAAAFMTTAATAVLTPRLTTGVRRQGHPRLAAPIVVYAAAIDAMTAAAWGTAIPLVAAGATLFLVSDGLFGWYHFVAPLAWGRRVNIVLYQLGQLGIALGVATIPR